MGLVRTMPAVLGFGTACAVWQGLFTYGGGIDGDQRDPNVDEYERKERLRKERRMPIEETIRELGEGRGRATFQTIQSDIELMQIAGIYGPGYAERRRERIKQKYGIEVPA